MFGDWCMHVAHLAPSPSSSKGPGAPRLGKPPMLKSISELRAWLASQSCSRERFLSKRSKSSLFMEPSVRVFTQNSAVESSYFALPKTNAAWDSYGCRDACGQLDMVGGMVPPVARMYMHVFINILYNDILVYVCVCACMRLIARKQVLSKLRNLCSPRSVAHLTILSIRSLSCKSNRQKSIGVQYTSVGVNFNKSQCSECSPTQTSCLLWSRIRPLPRVFSSWP